MVQWEGQKDKLQLVIMKGHTDECLRRFTLLHDLCTRARWLWAKCPLAVKENVIRWTQYPLVCGLWTVEANGSWAVTWPPVKLPFHNPCVSFPPRRSWGPWWGTAAWPGARLLAQMWEHTHSGMKGNAGGVSRVVEMGSLTDQGFKKENTSIEILRENRGAAR